MEHKMKRSLEWLAVPLIGVVAFWAYQSGLVHKFRAGFSFEQPAEVAVFVESAAEISRSKNDTELAVADSTAPVANIDLNEIQIAANAKVAKYSGWRQSRGQFVTNELGDYLSYNDDALTSLGKQGDLKALGVLTERLLRRGDNEECAYFANMAVIFGSTDALYILSELVGPIFASKENARTAVLESLAVTRVMEMRGDSELAERTRKGLAIGNRVDLNLTAEEKSLVEQRAVQIYANYQAIRNAKGLGDFDNSPSPFAKAQ